MTDPNNNSDNKATQDRALPPQVRHLNFLSDQGGATLQSQALACGDHNHVWRVRCGSADVVVRLPKAEAHSQCFYRAEFYNQACAHAMGLAPRIWAEDVRSGLLVSDYISGRTVRREDFECREFCLLLVRTLRRLHDSGQWFLYQHDFLRSVSKKIDKCQHHDFIKRRSTVYKMRLIVARIINYLSQHPIALCPIHADLALKNMILTPAGIQFIDWEVSGMGDRLEELAFLVFNSDLSPKEGLDFIKLYFANAHAEEAPDQNDDNDESIAKTVLYWLMHIFSWTVEHELRAVGAADPAYDRSCRDARITEFQELINSGVALQALRYLGLIRQ